LIVRLGWFDASVLVSFVRSLCELHVYAFSCCVYSLGFCYVRSKFGRLGVAFEERKERRRKRERRDPVARASTSERWETSDARS